MDVFQSTRPMRGATLQRRRGHFLFMNFNPRAPCGARLETVEKVEVTLLFQSTRPMRGATITPASGWAGTATFQSTRPMRGATAHKTLMGEVQKIFQSTRPMRGATAKVYKITLHTFATKGNS